MDSSYGHRPKYQSRNDNAANKCRSRLVKVLFRRKVVERCELPVREDSLMRLTFVVWFGGAIRYGALTALTTMRSCATAYVIADRMLSSIEYGNSFPHHASCQNPFTLGISHGDGC